MQFVRKRDNQVVTAKVWQRHGDHPKVRPATEADIPSSTNPRAYGWIEGVGAVLPGDTIVSCETDDTHCVATERMLRRDYVPVGG